MTPMPLLLKILSCTTSLSVTAYGLLISSSAKDNPTFMVGVLLVCFGMIVFSLFLDIIKTERSAS